jgi:tRNA A37 threonylcarbamoyladenosine modification protein TsaB
MLQLFLDTHIKAKAILTRNDEKLLDFEFPLQGEMELLPKKCLDAISLAGFKAQEITQIKVIKGPGSYTSLRMGAVFANTLAFLTKAQLFAVDLFDFFHAKSPEKSCCVVLQINKTHVLLKDFSLDESFKKVPIDHLETNLKGFVCGELEDEIVEKLQIALNRKWLGRDKLNNDFMAFLQARCTLVDLIEPFYIAAPMIQISKKNN